MSLMKRPPAGTKGNRYRIKVNCFPITPAAHVKTAPTYFQYHIEIHPDVKPIARRREILRVLQRRIAPEVFTLNIATGYDGKAILYSTRRLNFQGSESEASFEFSMVPQHHPQAGPPRVTQGPAGRGMFRVSLRLVQSISLSALNDVLQGGQSSEQAITANQALNVFLMQSTEPNTMNNTRIQVRTKTKIFSDVDYRDAEFMAVGFELWNGFFMNARPSSNRMLLNLDTTTTIMYRRGDLIYLAQCILGTERPNVRLLEDERHIPKLRSFLKKLRVVQQKAGKIGKVRTIRDIVPAAGKCTFDDHEGQMMTVEAYFNTVYGYKLMFPYIPGIRSQKGDIIPFELLSIVEGQMYKRQLNPATQKLVQRFSTQRPADRFDAICRGLQTFDAEVLSTSGLHVSQQPVMFDGRILEPPNIKLTQNQNSLIPRDGVWDLYRTPALSFYRPCTIDTILVISFDQVSRPVLQSFLRKMLEVMHNRGINLNRDFATGLGIRFAYLNPQGKFDEDIKQAILEMTNNAKTIGTFLLLVFLPPGGSAIRRTIKRIGDIKAGFASQCLMQQTQIERASPAYILNVVLKINVKMGGINSVPQTNGMEWIDKGPPTMIIGADVSHPGPGINRPSIASIVYSLDRNASKYCALTNLQQPRLEIIVSLKDMIKTAIMNFEAYNTVKNKEGRETSYLPYRVVVFRDGVSEGEYETVANIEFAAVKEAIAELYPKAAPTVNRPPPSQVKVTFVVVGKRHHIRLFPHDPRQPGTNRNGNCPAGLVADHSDLVNPGLFDFYLLSHTGILGTSRPAHYIVLKDENEFTSDSLQAFSYGLCHCYAAATRAVSIPAPVFYADLVCQRSDIHLRSEDVTSDYGTEDVYDEEQWRERFEDTCERQKKSMYFV